MGGQIAGQYPRVEIRPILAQPAERPLGTRAGGPFDAGGTVYNVNSSPPPLIWCDGVLIAAGGIAVLALRGLVEGVHAGRVQGQTLAEPRQWCAQSLRCLGLDEGGE
jgi:hypothetical protein